MSLKCKLQCLIINTDLCITDQLVVTRSFIKYLRQNLKYKGAVNQLFMDLKEDL